MSNNNFEQNGFIIDLGDAKDAAEIIYQLSNILEMPEAQNKKICLKLGNVVLSQSQLLSVKALINSMESELTLINSNSDVTKNAAIASGLEIEELTNEIEIETEPEAEIEAEAEEIKEEEPIEEVTAVEEPADEYLKEVLKEEIEQPETVEEAAPEVKIESRVIAEELPEEFTETQEEKIESDYELFDPKEEVKFEKRPEAESKLEEMIEKENPSILEKRDMEKEISKLPTLYHQDTLRSGQTMSYDGNVVIIGDVHPGSEVIAKGDITVWGVLGGIAHAGARGNDYAKIRALKMNAIQLRISGYYARRPDTFNIPYIQRTNEFTPEEARVENEQIAIYKIYD